VALFLGALLHTLQYSRLEHNCRSLDAHRRNAVRSESEQTVC